MLEVEKIQHDEYENEVTNTLGKGIHDVFSLMEPSGIVGPVHLYTTD